MGSNDHWAQGHVKISTGHCRSQDATCKALGKSAPPWACCLVYQIQSQLKRHPLQEAFLDPHLKLPLVTLPHGSEIMFLSHVYCLNTILPFIHTTNVYILGSAGLVVSPFLHRHCRWGDRQTIIKANKIHRRRHIYNLVVNDKEVKRQKGGLRTVRRLGYNFI